VDKQIIKDFPVKDLIPYEKNYLKHEKNIDYIYNSLGTFGYVKISIMVNEKNTLIAGHGTLEAIKKLGWETVPEVLKVSGLTKKQQSAIRIADNTTAKDAEIDFNMLNFELDFLEDDFNMEDFGLDMGVNLEDAEADMPELAEGEKVQFEKMTFILSDEQIKEIKEVLIKVKKSEYYKYIETFGNEDSSGNCLYSLIMEYKAISAQQ